MGLRSWDCCKQLLSVLDYSLCLMLQFPTRLVSSVNLPQLLVRSGIWGWGAMGSGPVKGFNTPEVQQIITKKHEAAQNKIAKEDAETAWCGEHHGRLHGGGEAVPYLPGGLLRLFRSHGGGANAVQSRRGVLQGVTDGPLRQNGPNYIE